MQQAPPTDFIRFVKLSTTLGAERALVEVYEMNASELERDWRLHATSAKLAAVQ
jgi:hypothetical protein